MQKGGYQILDFHNQPFEGAVGRLIDGVYDRVEGSRKTFLISGLTLDDKEFHDIFASPDVTGTAFRFHLNFGDTVIEVLIQDNDVVIVDNA